MSFGELLLTAFIAYLVYKLLSSSSFVDKKKLEKILVVKMMASMKGHADYIHSALAEQEAALRSGDPVQIAKAFEALDAVFKEDDDDIADILRKHPDYKDDYEAELARLKARSETRKLKSKKT